MDNNENIYLEATEKLKKLIKQVGSSGIAAWEAGQILSTILKNESYRLRYKTFENYTKTEFGVNEKTAKIYISIFDKFDKKEIGNLMLVTHLKTLAKIENDKTRKLVLKSFRNIEENIEANEKTPFNLSDIIATVSLVETTSNNDISEEEINEVVNIVIEKSKEQKKKKKTKKKHFKIDKPEFGAEFKSDYFPEISALIKNEPIDEMGLVALFCIMFYTIRGMTFKLKDETISFLAINYVRAPFPDANIRCRKVNQKKTNIDLDIEFEYESYNYIKHGHLKSDKKCDMIICWIDNARNDERLRKNINVKKIPPILSIKDFFENGQIDLIT